MYGLIRGLLKNIEEHSPLAMLSYSSHEASQVLADYSLHELAAGPLPRSGALYPILSTPKRSKRKERGHFIVKN